MLNCQRIYHYIYLFSIKHWQSRCHIRSVRSWSRQVVKQTRHVKDLRQSRGILGTLHSLAPWKENWQKAWWMFDKCTLRLSLHVEDVLFGTLSKFCSLGGEVLPCQTWWISFEAVAAAHQYWRIEVLNSLWVSKNQQWQRVVAHMGEDRWSVVVNSTPQQQKRWSWTVTFRLLCILGKLALPKQNARKQSFAISGPCYRMLISHVCCQDCQYRAVNEQARLATIGAPWGPPTKQLFPKKVTPSVAMIGRHITHRYVYRCLCQRGSNSIIIEYIPGMNVSNWLQFHFGSSLARSQSAFVHALCGDDFRARKRALYSDRSVLHRINPESVTYLSRFVAEIAADDR